MMERYVIHVTKECNCDCLYCYEKDKTSVYTWPEIKKLLDDIVLYNKEFSIEFLGGEPLLAFDLIKQSYYYLESLTDVLVHDYAITSNGTILTPEIIEFLQKNKKVSICFSMDGHSHANQLRVLKDSRKNTYHNVMENVKKMQENGLTPSIHMVSHLYNVSMIADSISHLYALGIRHVDVGTIENTMVIDAEYCDRFIKEMKIVSDKIHSGIYNSLNVGILQWLKPKDDVRTYLRDKDGKLLGESYGRATDDLTQNDNQYAVLKCDSSLGDTIYNIRKTVYDYHNKPI